MFFYIKILFVTIYFIFQTRTLWIQYSKFGRKLSNLVFRHNPKILGAGHTPLPFLNKNWSTGTDYNFNVKPFGDMFSTQYNQIWSSANSFFRNKQKFACFLECWPEILIAVNWRWSLGKSSSLSKNWDYWEIAENMVKLHNLVNKSCCKPG